MSSTGFYGWRLLGAFWIVAFINLAFPAYGASVLNAAMATELGLDRQTLGTVVAIYLAMSGLPGPAVGWSVARYGVRTTLLIGSALIISGSLLMGTVVTTGPGAIIGFGLLVGVGVAFGGLIASQVGVMRWFLRRRSLALSLLYSGGAIGGFFAPPLLARIAQSGPGHWRWGWFLMAALSAGAALLAWLTVKEQPADLGQHPDGIDPAAAAAGNAKPLPAFVTREAWTAAEVLRGPQFWLMTLSFCGVSMGFALFLGHGIVHLRDLGHPMTVGAWAMSTLTLSGLLAKGLLAAFGDRLDPRYLWGLFCASFGIGLLVLLVARTPTLVSVAAACMGIGFGGGLVAMMAVMGNYYGAAAFAAVSGLGIAINTGTSAIAPIGAGFLFDHGFGYTGAFSAVATWCIVGGLVIMLLPKPRRTA